LTSRFAFPPKGSQVDDFPGLLALFDRLLRHARALLLRSGAVCPPTCVYVAFFPFASALERSNSVSFFGAVDFIPFSA